MKGTWMLYLDYRRLLREYLRPGYKRRGRRLSVMEDGEVVQRSMFNVDGAIVCAPSVGSWRELVTVN